MVIDRYWIRGKCAHCDDAPAGAEDTMWCAACLEWWRAEYAKSEYAATAAISGTTVVDDTCH